MTYLDETQLEINKLQNYHLVGKINESSVSNMAEDN